MPIELERSPPIDRSRAGILGISLKMIGDLLRLPPGLAVSDGRVSANGHYLELLVEGEPMPPVEHGHPAGQVTIVLHEKRDETTGLTTVSAAFAHAPGDTWIMREPHKRGT